jgi:hypothetical protein
VKEEKKEGQEKKATERRSRKEGRNEGMQE